MNLVFFQKPTSCFQKPNQWLHPQICAKYSKLAKVAEHTLLPFRTTYLVECGFSVVTDILVKKRGTLSLLKTAMLFSSIFFAGFMA